MLVHRVVNSGGVQPRHRVVCPSSAQRVPCGFSESGKVRSVRKLIVSALFAAVSVVSRAQENLHTGALAAGYKAAFMCSGVFTAGQTAEQVAADDLEGIYVQYQALVRSLPAPQVDRTK